MKPRIIETILCTLLAAMISASSLAADSAETLAEQAEAIAVEANPQPSGHVAVSPQIQGVAGPLFAGVDDVTVGAFRIDVVTDSAVQAFTGAEVWGAAYDVDNDRVLFNSGADLMEWPIGGAVSSLGTITDGISLLTMTGLAFGNDTLYGCRNIANEAIYEVDLTTLEATVFIDYVDEDFDCGGLAFNPDDGFLYMTSDDTTPGRGLYRMNLDGTGTLITAYPPGQTDIDGLAIGDGRAYLVIDEPGDLYVWDFALAAYQDPLTSPFATSETFSGGTWIDVSGIVEADLTVTLADAPDPVNAGENLTYTVTVTNNGPSDADNVSISLPLPAGSSFVSVNGGVGSVCNAASPVTCAWAGQTANGASRVATIVAEVASSTVGVLNSTSTAVSDTSDPNPANNSASATTGVNAIADLSITKAAVGVPDPLLEGSSFSYVLTASNAGPSDAEAVVVTDDLPATLNYVSDDCGAVFVAPTLTWNVGTLASGANALCNLNVSVAALGEISNTATIVSDTTDSDVANNASTSILGGAQPADVAIALTSDVAGNLEVGDSFIYTVTGSNNGPGDATGLDFTLELSGNLTFDSSTCGAVLAGTTLSWSVPNLASGASAVCEITVTIDAAGDIPAQAVVTTATSDPVLGNNSDELVEGTFEIAIPVPVFGYFGLLLLGLFLGGVGVAFMRRE